MARDHDLIELEQGERIADALAPEPVEPDIVDLPDAA